MRGSQSGHSPCTCAQGPIWRLKVAKEEMEEAERLAKQTPAEKRLEKIAAERRHLESEMNWRTKDLVALSKKLAALEEETQTLRRKTP